MPQKAAAVNLARNVEFGCDSIEPGEKEGIVGVTLGSRMSLGYQLMEGEDCVKQQVSRKMRGFCQPKIN